MLHGGEYDRDTFAVCFFIGVFQTNNGIIKQQGLILQTPVFAKDIDKHIGILARRAKVHCARTALPKLYVLLIQEWLIIAHQMGILPGEYINIYITIIGVQHFFTITPQGRQHQAVASRRQLLPPRQRSLPARYESAFNGRCTIYFLLPKALNGV